jgi:hypothetical protein
MSAELRVVELQPGEHEVTHPAGITRVLVPAGVGVPGIVEEDLVVALVRWYATRGEPLPAVVDLSALLGARPGLGDELAELVPDEDPT